MRILRALCGRDIEPAKSNEMKNHNVKAEVNLSNPLCTGDEAP